ncbi:MAG: DUF4160 domain-containing protein [Bacteroidota bacterium]|nr:DUF4160 domain-containing protein [Bacteroidota bacterium]MDP4232940.1 DUF4160 domain-containing protein [Bacteroidota bacterium]MDP4241984.1 DUF4160 domain-containing protein [Bacteroidota bacterium]MDP4286887.1 DUF4160 domain-containing protein [Bacteroidota bacterium]
MPEISRFLGIVITMYEKDHGPPHFHARYAEYFGKYSIQDLRLLAGNLPRRIHSAVLEWASDHREELMDNWNALLNDQPIKKIEPLI